MEKANPVNVGVIGCGAISSAYLEGCRAYPQLRIAALADINPAAAAEKANAFGIDKTLSVEAMLADASIDLILNLTIPKAHAPITLAALAAHKHVYCEKPLAITRDDGVAILNQANAVGREVGCAPDTFLGAGLQTARHAIDSGMIGRPVAFTAFMMGAGHESWHPSPEFYYEIGGGPMFDMGPYYLTALLNFFGPVRRIMGMANIAIPHRTITSQPKFGKTITVETPDHFIGAMEFASGVTGSIIQSFATRHPPYGASPIVVYGTDGTLQAPDPNRFNDPVRLRRKDDADWSVLPPIFSAEYSRSAGLAEMALALQSRRSFRANAQQAFAVLDLMQGFLDSSETSRAYVPVTEYEKPEPLKPNHHFGQF